MEHLYFDAFIMQGVAIRCQLCSTKLTRIRFTGGLKKPENSRPKNFLVLSNPLYLFAIAKKKRNNHVQIYVKK